MLHLPATLHLDVTLGAPEHVYLDVAGVPLDSPVTVLRPSAT